MKRNLILSLLAIIPAMTGLAQVTPKTGSKLVKDSFALNVLNTGEKVLRLAEDESKHPMLLAGELLKTDNYGKGIYQPVYTLPGAIDAGFSLYSTDRQSGNTRWEWNVRVYEAKRGTDTVRARALFAKLDSLAASLRNRKKNGKGEYSVYTSGFINDRIFDQDYIMLHIIFKRGLYNTEQGAIDSLIRLYQPLLLEKNLLDRGGELFARALRLEGLSDEKANQVFGDVAVTVADRNVEAAFRMMLSAPYFIEVKKVKERLSSTQQSQVTSMAQKWIDDFHASYNKKPAKDVVVEKKKQIEKEAPPQDPCKREIWELAIKPGYYVSGNGHIAYVRDYSCQYNTYSIAYQDPKQHNKLVIKTGVPVADMRGYNHTSEAPFIICSHCQGAGHSLEYDWYQMGVGSNHYARSNEQRKYSCGVCKGAGYIKVR